MRAYGVQDCGHNEDDNRLLTFSKIETKEKPYKKGRGSMFWVLFKAANTP